MVSANPQDGVDDCEPGYYCNAGTTRIRPTDVNLYNGDICPATKYCEKKTTTPSDCPVGTYSDGLGLVGDWECSSCMHGKVCASPGMNFAYGRLGLSRW
jgi:hypothetical protein